MAITATMNRFNDDDESSSVATNSDASSRINRAHSLVKLPSMYSPASKASNPPYEKDSPMKNDDASFSSIDTNASSIDIDYDGLPVSDEIKELFGVIGNYEPVDLELETPLKCFMP